MSADALPFLELTAEKQLEAQLPQLHVTWHCHQRLGLEGV